MGICEVLIPLTNSPSIEVQGNSAAAIGNLSSKGKAILPCPLTYKYSLIPSEGRSPNDDYGPFNDVWDHPEGGLHKYLHRFLSSTDATFQHIAVWTIVQLLESGDQELLHNIRSSTLLAPHIAQLATASHSSTPSGSTLGSRSAGRSRSNSFSEDGGGDGGDGGAAEIAALARRILEITEDDIPDGAGLPASEKSARSEIESGSVRPGDDVLRKSVRDALRGQTAGKE